MSRDFPGFCAIPFVSNRLSCFTAEHGEAERD
ncbi:rCG28832 [Rattus norvegicus]|uniref:RCG28832 n=1 Tax=Rattus norvegicus TaxID=10116 RepID=A6HVE7_RAT|nr:rCG28832 [Rattus norvegicus]